VCSPAATGAQDTFIINCGIGREQGQKMLVILNKILANQIDPQAVMAKLDEILKAVNPNAASITYDCVGIKRIAEPGKQVVSDEAVPDSQEMNRLLNARNFPELLAKSLAEISSRPEWLTARLFAAMAYMGLNDTVKAKEMIADFDAKTGPAYDVDGCKQMADYLHQNLP
jgi:hypothetical protein